LSGRHKEKTTLPKGTRSVHKVFYPSTLQEGKTALLKKRSVIQGDGKKRGTGLQKGGLGAKGGGRSKRVKQMSLDAMKSRKRRKGGRKKGGGGSPSGKQTKYPVITTVL